MNVYVYYKDKAQTYRCTNRTTIRNALIIAESMLQHRGAEKVWFAVFNKWHYVRVVNKRLERLLKKYGKGDTNG